MSQASENAARAAARLLREFDGLPDAAGVPVGVVAALWSITPTSVWRRSRQGDLPQPRTFGTRCTRWNVGELRAALRAAA